MSGHNALHDLGNSVFEMLDPGDVGTIRPDRFAAVCPVVTTAAQTRTLAAPLRAGMVVSVVLKTDGGDLTLTVTNGYNADADTAITFADAGDFVTFISILVGSTYYWRVLAHEGTNLSTEDLAVDQLTLNGAIATAYGQWLSASNQLGLFGPARPRGFNAISPRYELKWVAGARGKPGINADNHNTTEATRESADPDFEILGTNASSDDVTFYAEGGVTFQTDGADNDQVILLPHLDANQTAWASVTWGTDQETEWECLIRTSASVATQTIWAGLKLTNVSVTVTDDDQAFFRYAAATNSGKWEAIGSRAGTDVETDSGVTVAANTDYHLKITIDASLIPRFYINGVLVSTGTALVTGKDFIPYIGIHANHATAHSLHVRGQAISRKLA